MVKLDPYMTVVDSSLFKGQWTILKVLELDSKVNQLQGKSITYVVIINIFTSPLPSPPYDSPSPGRCYETFTPQ
jgi:hypothetical protein